MTNVGKLVRIDEVSGLWKVAVWGSTVWAGCIAVDETAKALAVLATDGVAWVRKTEINFVEIEGQGSLL